ncbi:alpha/beta hydrolase [Mobilicoccus pelagius]|uniref:DUF1023 domain-containing protein n=1 Tax=Mobilicoccus pelagius NBRC 104925 TaxID=1089455 RepID=H5UT37_9MICO|nr:alpha/beta hydrolase [Mobilicoccus pelagius]GAB48895.1 hypothetical protein MOPEL_084_00300 [Mobilicoccus pelagius NBRC 104925]
MPEETLAGALERIADELAGGLADARLAHEAVTRLPRRLDSLGDEILAGRTRVELLWAERLVTDLRLEAAAVRRRAPRLALSGAPLPPRPPDDDPEVVAAWWAAMTEQEREDVLLSDPVFVGGADGLPLAVRHRANLRVLDDEIERRRSAGHRPGTGADGGIPWIGGIGTAGTTGGTDAGDDVDAEELLQRERDSSDLRGLLKLRAVLDPQTATDDWADDRIREDLDRITTPVAHRWCYLLDASSHPLRAAVLLGDLDTADRVVLHVPGATTSLDLRLLREMAWMSNLRAEAGRYVGAVRVAVLDWIGYQTPQDIAVRRPLGDSGVPLLLPGQAADPHYAQEAVPDLVRCAEGLRTVCLPGTRLTGSGHSYGGSVLGLGLAATGVFDAAAVAGCPGLFTTDVATLHVPEGEVYAAAAPGDLVALLGVFGAPTHQVAGIRSLSTRTRPVVHPDGSRALLLPVFGHESYYNLGSVTLHGIGAVVAGATAQVRATRREGRGGGTGGESEGAGLLPPPPPDGPTP